MRLVCLANNRVGLELVKWLSEQPDELVGVAVHPPTTARFRNEILGAAGLPPSAVFDGSRINDTAIVKRIRSLEPDMLISIYFGFILKEPLITVPPRGCINIHPALLPYNRGAHPNVWSIIDGTPAGVSVHYIDGGIDTGALIAQREVEVEPVDTGKTLYEKLEDVAIELFKQTWPGISSNTIAAAQQRQGGSHHQVSDLRQTDRIDLDRQYTARELINLLRARTFPPYPSAYIEVDGKQIQIEISLKAMPPHPAD